MVLLHGFSQVFQTALVFRRISWVEFASQLHRASLEPQLPGLVNLLLRKFFEALQIALVLLQHLSLEFAHQLLAGPRTNGSGEQGQGLHIAQPGGNRRNGISRPGSDRPELKTSSSENRQQRRPQHWTRSRTHP